MTMSVRTALLVLPLCCGVAAGSAFAQANATSSTAPKTPAQATGQSSTAPARTAGAPAGPGEPAPPAHPLTTDQTAEFLKLMGFQTNMENMLTQTIAMQKQQAPFVPADVWTDFQSSFTKVDYNTVLQPVFAKYLSQEDAAKALEFYRTPAGQRVLASTPMLMRDIAVTAQQNGQKVSREVIERHRPEIEAAQKKYQEDQQKSSGAGAGTGAGSTATPPAGSSTTPKSTTTPNSTTSPNTTTTPNTTPNTSQPH